MTQKLEIIEKAITPISEIAFHLKIESDLALKKAVSILSQLNQFNDSITEEKEKVTKPLNEALKAERARWKPIETRNSTAIDAIRLEMTRYQTALIKSREEAEQSIVTRVAPGKGHLSPETAVSKLEALPTVEKEHATEEGLVQFRATPTLKVTDLSAIPGVYFSLDEAKLLKDLKAGVHVTGAEIEIKQTVVNFR